jgi:hypothetical protein
MSRSRSANPISVNSGSRNVGVKGRGCRTMLTLLTLFRPSQAVLAERSDKHGLDKQGLDNQRFEEPFDQQWRKLRRHATIERDPNTLLWLAAELDKRKRQANSASTCRTKRPFLNQPLSHQPGHQVGK